MSLCATQWLAGLCGPYGLNHVAIHTTAQALDIRVDRAFLEKLRYFEAQALQIVAKKPAPGCDAAQRERCTIEYGEHLEWTCRNCEQR